MSTLFGYEVVEQAHEIDRLSTEIASLTEENERLKALVMQAFTEGFGHAWGAYYAWLSESAERDMCWEYSDTRAALQPKEDK